MTFVKYTKRRGCVVGLGICCVCILFIIYNYAFHNYLLLEPYDSRPSWSPDGQRIVYTCLQRQRTQDRRLGVHFGPYEGYDQFKLQEICVIDADGNNRLQLTDNHGQSAYSPVWSPDGRQIAYFSGSRLGETDIYVAEIDNWHPVNLTHNPGSLSRLRWASSGEYLAFISDIDGGMGRLSVLRLWDGKVTQLLVSQQYIGDFAWSPNSELIAFIAGESWLSNNEIYTVSISDMKTEPIIINSSKEYSSLTWSPDGQHISYVASLPKDSFSAAHNYQICMLNIDTYSETVIAEIAEWPLEKIAWSSDGRFLSYMEDSYLHIWDRIESVFIASSTKIEDVITLDWAPDSYRILIYRLDDWNNDGYEEPKLWLLDIETGRLTPLSGWFPWRGREVRLDFSK